MKRVEACGSSIEGKGIFTLEEIHPDEHILDMDDSHIVEDINKLSEEDKDHLDYLAARVVLMQAPEVYINHSCEPSTYTKTVDGKRKLFAMKKINAGDEITYDYAINGDYDWGVMCHCGTKSCRGMLDNNFWHLPLEKQKGYLPYLDYWFRDKYVDKIKLLENT